MDLSRQLLKQFSDITTTPMPKSEITVYAKVLEVEDSIGTGGLLTGKVQIDGSTERTPVTSAVKIAEGDRVIVRLKDHTATVIGNIHDPSASDKVVTNIVSRVDDMEGNITEIIETAEGITTRVQDVEENLAEVQITAEGLSSRVTGVEESVEALDQATEEIIDEMTEIRQTAGEVRVTLQRPDRKLETFITTAGQWNALYTSLVTGEVLSGFYFDFAIGRFVYDGTGIFRSEDGEAYIQIKNDRLSLYAKDIHGDVVEKVRVGFIEGPNADYPYVVLGDSSGDGNAGLIKKFYDGLFIGNSHALNATGNFSPKSDYAGIFINTNDGTTSVVEGTKMKSLYTGLSVAKFR